jgi:hypothetical protein
MLYFSVDATVSANPSVDVKKRHRGGGGTAPLHHRQLGNSGELTLVIWEAPMLETVHDQQDVNPMLKRGQVHRVGQIITDIPAHPMIVFGHNQTTPCQPSGR